MPYLSRCVLALALAIALAGGAEQAVAAPVAVSYPGPGWRFASPLTGITFRGLDTERLSALRVTGSVSGSHSGRLHALRDERGAVFTPATPFHPGESVSVEVGEALLGAPSGAFKFMVAAPGQATTGHPNNARTRRELPARAGARGVGPCRPRRVRYHTMPDFRPVAKCMSRPASRATARGRLLVTPRSWPRAKSGDQHSVMMLARSGRLLWYLPRPYVARDLKTVVYKGRRALAFYQWTPHRRSHYLLLDEHYEPLMRVAAGNGYMTNTHELQLTSRGSAYLPAYARVRESRCECTVSDFLLQEVDVETGDVLFEWHSLDHVPLSASYRPRPRDGRSWDYFHGNSIEPARAGGRTIIVSARNTSAVYGIDRGTGEVRWTLGGKQDDFGLVERHPRWQFCAQHDARRLPNGDITIFDDGGLALGNERACPLHTARAQQFRLDIVKRTARLVGSVPSGPSSENGAGYLVSAMGSARRQANGNTLVSWGTNQRVTEVTPDGRVAFALRLGRYTYRAVRSGWRGLPFGRPLIEARRRGRDRLTLWASWNGATEVRSWRVLVGASPSTLRPLGRPHRFVPLETTINVAGTGSHVAVEALDSAGTVIGRSSTGVTRPGS